MDEFRIDVRTHNSIKLKVTWIGFLPYYVNSGNIKKIAKRIRDTLSALVTECQKGAAKNSGATLRRLAEHGRELYDEFFRDAGESDQAPQEILAFFKKYPDTRITLSVDETIHVPWGLIYDGDVKKLGAQPSTDPQTFSDFWCMRHSVATMFYRLTLNRMNPIPGDALKLLPVVNKFVFEPAQQQLQEMWEKDWLDWILTSHEPVYSSSEFKTKWKENAAHIGLLYFYCHADGTRLEFDTGDSIEADQLGREFARTITSVHGREWSCLLFLNGCSTATGDPAGAFLAASGEKGMCGFIGTEAEVPDLFALRFGIEFLYLFLVQHKTLNRVMLDMQRKHFPLSLLYGVYTHPLLSVTPALNGPQLDVSEGNYSFGQIGTGTL